MECVAPPYVKGRTGYKNYRCRCPRCCGDASVYREENREANRRSKQRSRARATAECASPPVRLSLKRQTDVWPARA